MIIDIMAIPLTQGLYALVDGEDFDWLNQWKWLALTRKHTNYAARRVLKAGKYHTVMMHQYILPCLKEKEIDHINHNGLDNRTQNQANQKIRKGGVSKYKGVVWNKRVKKWGAGIMFNYQHIGLGYFDNEIDAARAYDKKAKELWEEFANVNAY